MMPRPNTTTACRASAALLLALVVLPQLGRGQSLDERYLAGLRERRLFELAETYCLARLDRDDLEPADRVGLAVELVRCYGEQALQLPPGERAAYWQKAHQTAGDFAQAWTGRPRVLLVEVQDALTWLAQGELARQEAELTAGGAERIEEARDCLRSAIRALEKLDGRLALALRQPRRSDGPAAGLTAAEVDALQKNLAYQAARTLRNQGECYPPQSADRANSITAALEKLDRLAELAVADDVVWRSRLDRVVCYRLVGDPRRAVAALAELIGAKPPEAIALEAQAEKIRLLIAAGEIDQALAEAGATASAAARSANLAFAQLESHIAALRAAGQAKDPQRLAASQARAAELVRQIEEAHGPYWMRRAETLLARSLGSSAVDRTALVRSAESFYRSGQIAEALAAYDRAFALAKGQGDVDAAFDVAFTAATIEHARAHHNEALARYRRLAQQLPQHPRAAKAHLLAVLNLAELVRAAPADRQPALLDEYRQLLQEQLDTWPQGPSADQARLWQGNLLRNERHWEAAVAAYRGVSSDHPQYEAAVTAAGACYLEWLAELAQSGEAHDDVAVEAARYFENLVVGPERRWPEKWSQLQRTSALTAARIRLRHTTDGAPAAERMLTAALTLTDDAPAPWLAQARTLLIVALAAQGRLDGAAQAIDALNTVEAGDLVELLGELDALADRAPPDAARSLAQVELKLAERIDQRNEELRPEQVQQVRQHRAAALFHAGRREEALQAYEKLAAEFPRDGQIHERYAALLARADDPQTLGQALAKWHEVETKSRPGTARWFQARYGQAELFYRLNQPEKAAKLIRLTQVLQPELGGPELKTRFLQLLARCGGESR